MSCLVSEARKEAGMAAEKIHGVRKGGRWPAAWILVLTDLPCLSLGLKVRGCRLARTRVEGLWANSRPLSSVRSDQTVDTQLSF